MRVILEHRVLLRSRLLIVGLYGASGVADVGRGWRCGNLAHRWCGVLGPQRSLLL